MDNKRLLNKLRAFHFICGMLTNQQFDPMCSVCLSFAKNAEDVKKMFMEFEKTCSSEKEELPDIFRKQFIRLYELIGSIQESDNPVGQRKAGNCHFSQKICIVQEAMAIYGKLTM